MTDHAALLRAVFAHPDDDTPRLVFADFLDDHGEARRAAFIRDQIECARHANRHELDTYHTFLQWKDAAFAGECALDVWGVAAEFLFPLASWKRGFLESPAWTFEVWEDYAAAVLALHPVRRVRITFVTAEQSDDFPYRGATIEDPDGPNPREVDNWRESPRWPGIKFDLPPRLERNVGTFEFPRWEAIDPSALMRPFEQAAAAIRQFAAAVEPAIRQASAALNPILRTAAALQEPKSRKARRKRRR